MWEPGCWVASMTAAQRSLQDVLSAIGTSERVSAALRQYPDRDDATAVVMAIASLVVSDGPNVRPGCRASGAVMESLECRIIRTTSARQSERARKKIGKGDRNHGEPPWRRGQKAAVTLARRAAPAESRWRNVGHAAW